MTSTQAQKIIVDGVSQCLSRPLIRMALTADQTVVLQAIRDKAEQDDYFTTDVALRVTAIEGG